MGSVSPCLPLFLRAHRTRLLIPVLARARPWNSVTPLKSARRMADGFGNSSALLTHVGRGTSLSTHPHPIRADGIRS
jgi:hypothetical protein